MMLLTWITSLLSIGTVAAGGCCGDICGSSAQACRTEPLPIKACVADIFTDGTTICRYREALCRHRPCCDSLMRPVLICFKEEPKEKGPSCCFLSAVIQTIQAMGEEVPKGEKRDEMESVVKSIWKAAETLGATEVDLLNFTAIAMHNMYSLTKFVRRSGSEIGNTSRGLLQIKSKDAYQALKNVTGRDYISNPKMLDKFSQQSIEDEFLFFLACLGRTTCGCTKDVVSIVKQMNPEEAWMIGSARYWAPRNCKEEEYKRRIERRTKLYNNLCHYMQKCFSCEKPKC